MTSTLERVGTRWAVDGWVGFEGMPPVPDDLGCLMFVTSVSGWEGTPAPRVQSDDRPSDDGTNDGQSTQPGKTITINGFVRAPDVATLQQAMGRLSGILTTETRYDDLVVDEAWLIRRIRVRRGAEALVAPSRSVYPEATFSFVFYGPDARRLGDSMTDSTPLPSASGGLSIPMTVPVVIAETVVSGACSLYNQGTATGPVIARIDGPIVGPVITHVGTGQQLVFQSNLAIAAGDWLIVDMQRHEVLANGQPQATRNESVTKDGRGWSAFDKGDNTWLLTAQSGGPAARLSITASPAWT